MALRVLILAALASVAHADFLAARAQGGNLPNVTQGAQIAPF
eukprot:CAMPEP_0168380018 /NCGR_PEP_ID=MMETSP0228-20121227/12141_1 /TAXON_ID=133427 /ORGANISM="Protoceratium reticulatum, Strain CCCM 535 (=CCMP 1889)" /LENGTH=41 /DNA_ID= /DNA_START= /DNA_END= /DNA_ORIENTATION=